MAMQLDSYFTRPEARRYLLIEQSCDNQLHHFTFSLEIRAGESRHPHIEHKAGASGAATRKLLRRPECLDAHPDCSGS
jgi:hypothetical protein